MAQAQALGVKKVADPAPDTKRITAALAPGEDARGSPSPIFCRLLRNGLRTRARGADDGSRCSIGTRGLKPCSSSATIDPHDFPP